MCGHGIEQVHHDDGQLQRHRHVQARELLGHIVHRRLHGLGELRGGRLLRRGELPRYTATTGLPVNLASSRSRARHGALAHRPPMAPYRPDGVSPKRIAERRSEAT